MDEAKETSIQPLKEKVFLTYKKAALNLTLENSINSIISVGSTGERTKRKQRSYFSFTNQPFIKSDDQNIPIIQNQSKKQVKIDAIPFNTDFFESQVKIIEVKETLKHFIVQKRSSSVAKSNPTKYAKPKKNPYLEKASTPLCFDSSHLEGLLALNGKQKQKKKQDSIQKTQKVDLQAYAQLSIQQIKISKQPEQSITPQPELKSEIVNPDCFQGLFKSAQDAAPFNSEQNKIQKTVTARFKSPTITKKDDETSLPKLDIAKPKPVVARNEFEKKNNTQKNLTSSATFVEYSKESDPVMAVAEATKKLKSILINGIQTPPAARKKPKNWSQSPVQTSSALPQLMPMLQKTKKEANTDIVISKADEEKIKAVTQAKHVPAEKFCNTVSPVPPASLNVLPLNKDTPDLASLEVKTKSEKKVLNEISSALSKAPTIIDDPSKVIQVPPVSLQMQIVKEENVFIATDLINVIASTAIEEDASLEIPIEPDSIEQYLIEEASQLKEALPTPDEMPVSIAENNTFEISVEPISIEKSETEQNVDIMITRPLFFTELPNIVNQVIQQHELTHSTLAVNTVPVEHTGEGLSSSPTEEPFDDRQKVIDEKNAANKKVLDDAKAAAELKVLDDAKAEMDAEKAAKNELEAKAATQKTKQDLRATKQAVDKTVAEIKAKVEKEETDRKLREEQVEQKKKQEGADAESQAAPQNTLLEDSKQPKKQKKHDQAQLEPEPNVAMNEEAQQIENSPQATILLSEKPSAETDLETFSVTPQFDLQDSFTQTMLPHLTKLKVKGQTKQQELVVIDEGQETDHSTTNKAIFDRKPVKNNSKRLIQEVMARQEEDNQSQFVANSLNQANSSEPMKVAGETVSEDNFAKMKTLSWADYKKKTNAVKQQRQQPEEEPMTQQQADTKPNTTPQVEAPTGWGSLFKIKSKRPSQLELNVTQQLAVFDSDDESPQTYIPRHRIDLNFNF